MPSALGAQRKISSCETPSFKVNFKIEPGAYAEAWGICNHLLTLRFWIAKEKEQSRPVKWDAIAASLPRRSKKECRKRWHHTMMEAVRKCQWKPEEDERLSGAVQKYGKK